MDKITSTNEATYGSLAALRLHIGSRHALTNWRTTPDPEDYHQYEHDGPCTIRDHPRDLLDYDERKALAVEAEGREFEGDEGIDR